MKGFDLDTGDGKISAVLPGARTLCNDIVLGPDGSVYVTNTFAPQILRLTPGSTQLDVWLADPQFDRPKMAPASMGLPSAATGTFM